MNALKLRMLSKLPVGLKLSEDPLPKKCFSSSHPDNPNISELSPSSHQAQVTQLTQQKEALWHRQFTGGKTLQCTWDDSLENFKLKMDKCQDPLQRCAWLFSLHEEDMELFDHYVTNCIDNAEDSELDVDISFYNHLRQTPLAGREKDYEMDSLVFKSEFTYPNLELFMFLVKHLPTLQKKLSKGYTTKFYETEKKGENIAEDRYSNALKKYVGIIFLP